MELTHSQRHLSLNNHMHHYLHVFCCVDKTTELTNSTIKDMSFVSVLIFGLFSSLCLISVKYLFSFLALVLSLFLDNYNNLAKGT